MDFKFSNNLFLGRQELDFFKNSIKNEGYIKILKQMFEGYGVVRSEIDDPGFDYLRVIAGTSLGQLTIKAGHAIDSDINIIDVENDLVDELTAPADSVPRYVIINYKEETLEKGTVSVDANGALTGISTLFTEKLRGLPDFPAKIRFPNSASNTNEYIIQSVISDTSAQLNVAAGLMIAEGGLDWEIVGTFTPGIPVPAIDKLPFKNDGYEIRLDASPTVIAGQEFLLASVVNDGSTIAISDFRGGNILGLGDDSSDTLISPNPIISLVRAYFDEFRGDGSEVFAEVEWGFHASAAAWTFDSISNKLTVLSGSGGSLPDTDSFVDGTFDGWYVYYKNTGTKIKILSSIQTNPAPADYDIVLTLDNAGTFPASSSELIVIVPPGDIMELSVSQELADGTAQKTLHNHYAMVEGRGRFRVSSETICFLNHRSIAGDRVTPSEPLADGNYTNELNVVTVFNTSQFITLLKPDSRASWDDSWITTVAPTLEYTGLPGTPIATSTAFKYKKMGKTVHGSIRCNLDTSLTGPGHGYVTIAIKDLPFSPKVDTHYLNSSGVAADVNDGLGVIGFTSVGAPNNEIHVRLTDYDLGAPKEFQDNLKTLIFSFTVELE